MPNSKKQKKAIFGRFALVLVLDECNNVKIETAFLTEYSAILQTLEYSKLYQFNIVNTVIECSTEYFVILILTLEY